MGWLVGRVGSNQFAPLRRTSILPSPLHDCDHLPPRGHQAAGERLGATSSVLPRLNVPLARQGRDRGECLVQISASIVWLLSYHSLTLPRYSNGLRRTIFAPRTHTLSGNGGDPPAQRRKAASKHRNNSTFFETTRMAQPMRLTGSLFPESPRYRAYVVPLISLPICCTARIII